MLGLVLIAFLAPALHGFQSRVRDSETAFEVTRLRCLRAQPPESNGGLNLRFPKTVIAKAKGLKYVAKTFTLPDVQVGSIIEYYYTTDLSDHYVYDSHWILTEELFTRRAKFSLKRYTNNYSNVEVRWTWQRLPAGTVPPQMGPDKIIRLEVHDIPAFQAEDFMPPENEVKARVDFTYTVNFVERDPNLFWKKQGKQLNHAVETFSKISPL